MSAVWIAVAVALVVVWAITVADIFRLHRDRKHRLAWLLIVILLPFAGALLYWVLRRREPIGADGA
jgi:cytochrome bd-type quinol oxidase subunit 2